MDYEEIQERLIEDDRDQEKIIKKAPPKNEQKNELKIKLPPFEISHIDFGVYSTEEVQRISVCKLTSSKLVGEESVYDPRMGATDIGKLCPTCGLDATKCVGHFGRIDLCESILNPAFYKYIVGFLRVTCLSCHSILLSKEHLQLEGLLRGSGEKRFRKIFSAIEKISVCSRCSNPKTKITLNVEEGIIYSEYKKIKVPLSTREIFKVLNDIPNEDVELLGLIPKIIHPRNLIISSLLVLPPRARPFIVNDTSMCDDELTTQYLEIIKINNKLNDMKINEENDENKLQKLMSNLKFKVSTLFNNSKGKAKLTNGKPIKGIKERLNGKAGRIRSNLLGKRQQQSARTVIGPGINLRTDEIGVPERIAKNLSFPEVVTPFNIKNLTKLVNEGKANILVRGKNIFYLKRVLTTCGTKLQWGDVIRRGGKEIKTTDNNFKLIRGDVLIRSGKKIPIVLPKKKHFEVFVGDVVHRQLRNGDITILNRQPTQM